MSLPPHSVRDRHDDLTYTEAKYEPNSVQSSVKVHIRTLETDQAANHPLDLGRKLSAAAGTASPVPACGIRDQMRAAMTSDRHLHVC